MCSDREICRTCRKTSADVRQRAETLPDILSSRVRNTYNIRQGKQEWPQIFASHQLWKMSDRCSKCPAELWWPAGHFVRHARYNFRDHWMWINPPYYNNKFTGRFAHNNVKLHFILKFLFLLIMVHRCACIFVEQTNIYGEEIWIQTNR